MSPLNRSIAAGSPVSRRMAFLAVLTLVAAFIGVRRSADILPSAAQARQSSTAGHRELAATEPTAAKIPATLATVAWPEEPVRDLFRWTGEPTSVTQPPVDVAAIEQLARTRLELQGIVLGDTPQAILNGRARVVGDEIGGFRLIAIESRRIIVVREGVSVTLSLTRSGPNQRTGPE